MGDPLSEVSVQVVVFVLCGLIAINLLLLTALALTIREDRPAPGPRTGSESGSV